jgi:hypothetical protein
MKQEVYLARSPAVASRMIGAEMVIMSVRDSVLFVLDEAATWIWNAVDGATPLEAIVARTVCAEFEVASDEALRDAEALVDGLVQHGILLSSHEPIEGAKTATPTRDEVPS